MTHGNTHPSRGDRNAYLLAWRERAWGRFWRALRDPHVTEYELRGYMFVWLAADSVVKHCRRNGIIR